MMEINNTMVKTLNSSTTVEYTKAELDNIEGEYRNNYWGERSFTRASSSSGLVRKSSRKFK